MFRFAFEWLFVVRLLEGRKAARRDAYYMILGFFGTFLLVFLVILAYVLPAWLMSIITIAHFF